MKFYKIMLIVLSLVLLTSITFAVKVGQSVCANWGSSKYIAVVVGIQGEKVNVVYGDGDNATLKPIDVKVIPWDPKLKVGDTVLACWNNSAKFYTGTVLEVCQMSYKVKWDDGSTPSWVPATKILKK